MDDFGIQPLDHSMKLALLQIQEERYPKGATNITSQLPVKAWYEYIKEPALADGIMDRSDILDDSTCKQNRIKRRNIKNKEKQLVL